MKFRQAHVPRMKFRQAHAPRIRRDKLLHAVGPHCSKACAARPSGKDQAQLWRMRPVRLIRP
ncbi:hypothetical protein DMP06_11000 [Slackia equolifaciens]|uniref:Uncharacterized protein n=1 Tax=Slackia equolifaciens TaxID=498718 RepID=A0A3N0ARY8_9ACTN|nr:hypothetical protein DMP06_11000 [Slackia equolifaciens]